MPQDDEMAIMPARQSHFLASCENGTREASQRRNPIINGRRDDSKAFNTYDLFVRPHLHILLKNKQILVSDAAAVIVSWSRTTINRATRHRLSQHEIIHL